MSTAISNDSNGAAGDFRPIPAETLHKLETLYRLTQGYFGPWSMGSLEQRVRDFRTQAVICEVSDEEFHALKDRLQSTKEEPHAN